MTSILAVWAGLMLAAPPGPVTNVSVLPGSERTDLVISVDGNVDVRHFTMEGPSRLIVDLKGSKHALPAQNFPNIDRGGVRAIRTSQYSEDVVRVVVELEETVGYQVTEGDGYVRVSLENPEGSFEPWTSAAADGTPSASLAVERPAAAPAAAPRAAPSEAGGSDFPFQQDARRITVSFPGTPIRDVLFTFSEFSGRSIVPGANVEATVSADIRDQRWDIALQTILDAYGFAARELDTGIIRVDNIENLNTRETVEPLVTRAFRINYATASELSDAIEQLLTERGRITAGTGTNTLVVMDVPRVIDEVATLIDQLDIETPQVTISAKIIFVNRTDLNEFGVTYDLKDSQGNQLNVLNPGGIDENGDGIIELPEEQVEVGNDVISLGGNSVAALGNAQNRVAGPTLTLLTSLIIGRHTLINFVEALESVNLSDIQAAPSLTVMDNQHARILVGEETPLRVVDAQSVGGGAGGGGGAVAQATVQIQETGIILDVTPHITADGNILMELVAERSAAELASSDVGFIFQTQRAESRVLVEDGETIVIGGLTVTENTESKSGIPLLMDIPVLGRLFRVTRSQQTQRDLMILVTPHIVRRTQAVEGTP